MRLLLDTHSLLWLLTDDPRLSSTARQCFEEATNELLISIASLWEIAIKVSLGKLSLARPFEELFPAQLELNRIGVLGIDLRHLREVAALPFHHRDPFDRLLVAQAKVEELPILTRDSRFEAYPVRKIW